MNTIKYRHTRETLDEALETTVEFDSVEAFKKYIEDYYLHGFAFMVEYQCYDERCKWNSHYLCEYDKMYGWCAMGFVHFPEPTNFKWNRI
jgi:hypothetical protein